jgi:5-methylthioadenosine/S-adenosylhomocysteine deaminase
MFTGPDMFREMDFLSRLARVRAGSADAVDAKKVLSAATLGGAAALGLDGELGTLEPGKAASFSAIDFSTRNLRGVHDIHSAIVHRASRRDVFLIRSFGEDIAC